MGVDYEAISGIFGAISIACWVVVFSPQIIQNFRQKNADGLSLHFIIIWLIGDIFNIIGSILQKVLTSMIILAVYYTIADIALLCQMFFYRGFSLRDAPAPKKPSKQDEESREHEGLESTPSDVELVPETHSEMDQPIRSDSSFTDKKSRHHSRFNIKALKPRTPLQKFALNALIVLVVGAAGFLGWFVSEKVSGSDSNGESEDGDDLEFHVIGQVFGYLCAFTYIASRIPQLLLNWRRKATEGLSLLFFVFTFLANTTYIISILAYEPTCEESTCRPGESSRLYKRYFLINLSWILGSFINLTQDTGIFVQYFLYRNNKPN